MKITICGSINFAESIKEMEKTLKEKGHEVAIPYSIIKYNLNSSEDAKRLKESEDFNTGNRPYLTKKHFDEIKNSDAVLIVNQEKNGIPNYLGGATFAEMLFAFYMDKKIFMLNPVPTDERLSMFRDEIEAVNPIIINNNLEAVA